jgi:hypothetical protein
MTPGQQAFQAMVQAFLAKPLIASFAPHWLMRRPVGHAERDQPARASSWLKRTAP